MALRRSIPESNVDAATGRISFNMLGEVKKDIQVQMVKDSVWHHFAFISDPVLLAPPDQ